MLAQHMHRTVRAEVQQAQPLHRGARTEVQAQEVVRAVNPEVQVKRQTTAALDEVEGQVRLHLRVQLVVQAQEVPAREAELVHGPEAAGT